MTFRDYNNSKIKLGSKRFTAIDKKKKNNNIFNQCIY